LVCFTFGCLYRDKEVVVWCAVFVRRFICTTADAVPTLAVTSAGPTLTMV
jgi:hypothetical protein